MKHAQVYDYELQSRSVLKVTLRRHKCPQAFLTIILFPLQLFLKVDEVSVNISSDANQQVLFNKDSSDA